MAQDHFLVLFGFAHSTPNAVASAEPPGRAGQCAVNRSNPIFTNRFGDDAKVKVT